MQATGSPSVLSSRNSRQDGQSIRGRKHFVHTMDSFPPYSADSPPFRLRCIAGDRPNVRDEMWVHRTDVPGHSPRCARIVKHGVGRRGRVRVEHRPFVGRRGRFEPDEPDSHPDVSVGAKRRSGHDRAANPAARPIRTRWLRPGTHVARVLVERHSDGPAPATTVPISAAHPKTTAGRSARSLLLQSNPRRGRSHRGEREHQAARGQDPR